MLRSYDVLYQDWLVARRKKNYTLADSIRVEFERLHGLTIFAEGDMPIEGTTTRPMKASAWYKKFGGSPQLVAALERNESRFGPMRVLL